MKKLFYIIPFILMAFFVDAQNYHYEDWAVDTLTDAATVTFLVDQNFKEPGQYGFYCVADSLSGSTAATVNYQVAPIGGTSWTTIATGTVNGVQTILTKEARLYANKFRVQIVGTGTQSTKLKASFSWTKD